jgi:hypothetical protein
VRRFPKDHWAVALGLLASTALARVMRGSERRRKLVLFSPISAINSRAVSSLTPYQRVRSAIISAIAVHRFSCRKMDKAQVTTFARVSLCGSMAPTVGGET